eukprot:CAMPEP_0195518566 /NCGR_PEP_ID=MMETSP0794_2-20130614/13163_1 /TAXON_ID=515487 /ORGANISM="Stephanopyxis turris, Strain CCMP 815" /LENGTH=902 /DNA_ID=CAMNT_0040647559 /DNA_START=290 /DNA_END=2998 /DNA_ORIENTATION=-
MWGMQNNRANLATLFLAFSSVLQSNAFVPSSVKKPTFGGVASSNLQNSDNRFFLYQGNANIKQLSIIFSTSETSSTGDDAPKPAAPAAPGSPGPPPIPRKPMGNRMRPGRNPRRPSGRGDMGQGGNYQGRGPGGGRGNYQGRGPGGRGRGSFQGRGPPGGRGQGGGVSRALGNSLKLENPMKVTRIRQQQRDPRDGGGRGRGEGRGGRGRGGRGEDRGAGGESRFGGSDGGTSSAPDTTRSRRGGPKASKTRSQYDKKRTPLRVGNNRRGPGGGAGRRRGTLKKKDRSREKEARAERAIVRNTVSLPDGPMSVGALADLLDEKPIAIIKFLMTDLGVMAAITQNLDHDTCVAVVEGFGKYVGDEDDDYLDDDDEDEDEDDTALDLGFAWDEDEEEDLVPRDPVVTIMGHVDHGKTSLLDAIRNTRVVSGEAGGITQHIGAYQVKHQDSSITFIDTPGHAAFSDMRARGANITDIVILVVAADDGVKQQTSDSIACARQAGVPIVVAINKCDLDTADVARVKSDLTSYDVLTEDLGGDVLFSEVSAKEGTGLDELLSKVMLQAEIQDLKANPDRDAQGTVIEARVERGLGTVATALISRGTLKVGDSFVAGETSGRVRALIASDGKTRMKEAGPSTPVGIVGFGEGVPCAGDMVVVAEDEQTARELAAARQRIAREKLSSSYQSGLMDSVAAVFSGTGQKERREMCVVVKADVQGSAEALSRALTDLVLENDEVIVNVKVLVSDVGDITKTDVAIASVTPDTVILAFNCAATMAAMEDARVLNVPIGYYDIVYDAIESVESRMQEVLSPTPEGEYVGAAIVQEVFNIGGTGNIAGSKCQDGFLKKGSNVRVMRGDKILVESKIRTLRNFKAEVDQISAGDECGIGLTDYEDFQVGDIIESYVE